MPRLRDVAAYLYEQERIDGNEFEAVMAGRLRPADADGWRAAAASPRPWAAIPTTFQERAPRIRAMPSMAAATHASLPPSLTPAAEHGPIGARGQRRAVAGACPPPGTASHRQPTIAGHARPSPTLRGCGRARPRRRHGSLRASARRDDQGRFTTDQVDVGRSLAADQRQTAKATAKPRQGDRGDRRQERWRVTHRPRVLLA